MRGPQLVQERGSSTGFLLLAPVYRAGALPSPTGSDGDPLDDVHGFALGAFLSEDVLLRDYSADRGLAFEVFAGQDNAAPVVSSGEPHPVEGELLTPFESPLEIGDRTWRVVVSPSTEFASVSQFGSRLVLFAGMLVTGMLGLMLLVMTARASRIRNLIRERTEALDRSNRALKSAKSSLEETIEALELSNADLKQFAYVASHDLQEPLRVVASFTQILERKYGDQLDDTARSYMGYAVDGAKRMSALVHALLEFSRVGSGQAEQVEVDIRDLVQAVRRDLAMALSESGATVEVGDLPTVWGDPAHLRIVMQNLRSNAVKFGDPEDPRVEVSCIEQEAYWRFEVSDNGIGIEADQHDRVFEIFQRLHPQDEYPGTGIGLALCKRIVLQHGGTIGVVSELGQGARFWFTLPRREETETFD